MANVNKTSFAVSVTPKIKMDASDGINQEMHEFYRRGVQLSKVLNNMSAVLQTPAKVSVLTILFKHNQDYLEQIQDICRKLGVKDFDWVESNRFRAPTYKFNNEDGNSLYLEQVTSDRQINATNMDDSKRTKRRVRDYRYIDSIKDYTKIECITMERNNIKISFDGVVSPCCYLSHYFKILITKVT